MMMKKAVLLLAVCMLLLGGCNPIPEDPGKTPPPADTSSKISEKPSTAAPAEKTPEQAKSLEIEIYYPDDAGTKLIAVTREIDLANGDKYTAAVNALLTPPKERSLISIFPKHAKLRSVRVENGTAFVDFDSSIAKSFVGGSTGEELLVGSLVNTLTNFPEVKKVQILLNGKKTETLSGHMDLTEPLERMTGLLK